MPRQSHRQDKFPFDGLNRAAIIFDGDNVRNGLIRYGYLPNFDVLVDWISCPENLGIEKVVSACAFLTVSHANTTNHRQLPIKNRSRFCEHLLVSPKRKSGYKDDEMYREAIRLAPRIDTLVIVSSDGGADGGTYRFAAELRKGFDRFAGIYQDRLACEVVCISSHLKAGANWQKRAVNSVAIEDIFPEKLRPRLHHMKPFSAISA